MARPTNQELNSLKEEFENLIKSGNELVCKLEEREIGSSDIVDSMSEKLSAAEEDSNNIESLKQATQEDSNDIGLLKQAAQEDYNAIGPLKQAAQEGYNAIGPLKQAAQEGSDAIGPLKQAAQEGSDAIGSLKQAAQEGSDVIQSFKEVAQESSNAIGSLKQAAQEDSGAIESFKEVAQKSSNAVELLNLAAHKSSGVMLEQMKLLEGLSNEAHELKQTVENLLPGSTSAGLASAFNERKESFKRSTRLWGGLFIVSVFALLLVAYFNPIIYIDQDMLPKGFSSDIDYSSGIGELFNHLFVKLPFAVPIVWLAIYAGRRHGQLLKLQEEYAHKEALSKSFEGYKNQLIAIESNSEEKKSILKLIDITMHALSLHPGRIYQGKQEDITPLGSATNSISSVSNIVRQEKTKDK